MTCITKEAYEKFQRNFKKRVGTTHVCSNCGNDRLYGHGCTHCGKAIMGLLEFGDAMRIAAEREGGIGNI